MRESLAPELGSFRGSNFVLSVDEVPDELPLAVEVDDDEDEDEDGGDILDSGDFPGCLGRGATIVSSITGEGGTGAGLALLTGEEDTDYDNQ